MAEAMSDEILKGLDDYARALARLDAMDAAEKSAQDRLPYWVDFDDASLGDERVLLTDRGDASSCRVGQIQTESAAFVLSICNASPALLKLLRALLLERMPRLDVEQQVDANSAADAALAEFAGGGND